MHNPLSRRPLYVIGALFAVAAVLMGGILVVAKTNPGARTALLANPIVQHFKHTYNSVKKVSDILFIPYLFVPSSLPTYRVSISVDNLIRMNAVLPADSLNGHLREENKLFVKADFKDPTTNYSDRVNIKYRGVSTSHWNALQKSYRIQFPTTHLWRGERSVNFVTPYDRNYYIEPLNAYRAKKFGLLDLDMRFVRLNINGEDTGVYLEFEQWSPELLAKKGLTESKIFTQTDISATSTSPLAGYADSSDKADTTMEELAALLELRDHADNATFQKLLPHIMDMDKLYDWSVLTVLSGSTHQTEVSNAVLYFDAGLGKFELVPWDTEVADVVNHPYDDTTSLLMNRVLSIPEFRAERDKRLKAYLDDPANLADDLAFYDQLAAATQTDFFKDTYKFHTDFGYLSQVARDRQWIINAFDAADKVLDPTYTYPAYTPPGPLTFIGSFAHLTDFTRTIDQFLAWNPQFYKIDAYTVGLAGTHTFSTDVRIPADVALRIVPGTSLYLDARVSLFIRGPVHAEGTAEAPISISRLNPEKPWGTVAVINANATSTLAHVIADGGSGAVEDGVSISGMIAFHGGNVIIDRSSFSHSSNDDVVNTNYAVTRITNSSFAHSYSDAIDVNFAKAGSLFEGNTFFGVGVDGNGDAMDLSGSTVTIKGNTVDICNDKGVSVGERSTPVIEGNTFIGCTYGVAVKDLSHAYIAGNTFKKNKTAIGLYQKKQTFGGGYAVIGKNTFVDSETEVQADELSTVDYVP